jgi:hypothetical protein
MNIYPENVNNEFNVFLFNLNNIYPNEEMLVTVTNESFDQKSKRLQNLINSLNVASNFNNFCNSKIKVFSHKESATQLISESVFGKKLPLKKIFNNQPDEVKNKLWTNLHKMVLYLLEEECKTKPSKHLEERMLKLKENSPSNTLKIDQTKKSIQQLFQTDKLNDTTNDMINDIFKSFENAMSGKDTMANILNLSSELTHKYENKINNGEIDLNGLVNNLKNNVPGMENMKNIIDPLLKMDGMSSLSSLVGGTDNEPKEKVIIDENFSTANVNIGTEEETSKLVIGNMLKAVDGTGLLNMMSGDQNNSFNKLFDVVNKLKETGLDNREELNNVFKNELGIDMNKINQEMELVMKQNNIIEE